MNTSTDQKVVKKLPCNLTDTEKLRKATELGHKMAEIGRIQSDKKESASAYKAREEASQGVANEMGRALATGWEIRDVECIVLMDYAEGLVTYCRTDTHEIVEERRMSAKERQMRLSMG